MLDREPVFAEYDDDSNRYLVDIKTRAWYNGREKGVSLTVSRLGYKGCLVITFGEHRSSDSIFVDSWEMETEAFNSPTPGDFSDEAYKQRKSFPAGHVGYAADYIYKRMEAYYEGLMARGSGTPHWARVLENA